MYQFQLIAAQKMEIILPFLQLLNPDLSPLIIKKRLNDMLANGYQCLGVFEHEKLIGICGIWILHKIYVGKHIEPDNVIIHPDYRNKGIGEKMMQWVAQFAKENNCEALELNAYLSNEKGRKFWEENKYIALGVHFQKKIQ